MTRIAYIADRHATLVAMDPVDEHAWRTWLARHGIDPEDVLLDNELTCDDERRQIRYETLARDDNGKVIIDYDTDGLPYFRRTMAVVQLEAPALPFPPNGLPTEETP